MSYGEQTCCNLGEARPGVDHAMRRHPRSPAVRARGDEFQQKFGQLFFQAEDGIRGHCVTGVQTCALPIFGMVAAVVVDRLDPRVHHPDQVTEQMGLSIIGVLPHVRDRRAGPDDQQVAHAIEAMRSIRLSLTHAHGAAGPMLVTISSPGVGDGKSFVSANLALAFAEAGRRTLLIDGDVRRGSLHRAVRARRQPGLTDFLAGRAPFEATVQGTPYPDLQFIGAGTRFRDSPELLGSGAMSELLARLRASWSVILVDSPPLGSGVDPYTLGTLTSNMLLVLRTDATDLSLARTKLSVLDHLPIRLLGVVVDRKS